MTMTVLVYQTSTLCYCRSDSIAHNSATDVCTLALASLQKNKVFLGKVQLNTVKAIVIQRPMKLLKSIKRIGYTHLEQEVHQYWANVATQAFRMLRDYNEYGSTNRVWGDINFGQGFKRLLADNVPRKSKRINL